MLFGCGYKQTSNKSFQYLHLSYIFILKGTTHEKQLYRKYHSNSFLCKTFSQMMMCPDAAQFLNRNPVILQYKVDILQVQLLLPH